MEFGKRNAIASRPGCSFPVGTKSTPYPDRRRSNPGLQQPLRQAAVGAEPDHLDPVAVANRVPRRSAGEHVDVFEDRLLAEQLEPIVEIRPAVGWHSAAINPPQSCSWKSRGPPVDG